MGRRLLAAALAAALTTTAASSAGRAAPGRELVRSGTPVAASGLPGLVVIRHPDASLLCAVVAGDRLVTGVSPSLAATITFKREVLRLTDLRPLPPLPGEELALTVGTTTLPDSTVVTFLDRELGLPAVKFGQKPKAGDTAYVVGYTITDVLKKREDGVVRDCAGELDDANVACVEFLDGSPFLLGIDAGEPVFVNDELLGFFDGSNVRGGLVRIRLIESLLPDILNATATANTDHVDEGDDDDDDDDDDDTPGGGGGGSGGGGGGGGGGGSGGGGGGSGTNPPDDEGDSSSSTTLVAIAIVSAGVVGMAVAFMVWSREIKHRSEESERQEAMHDAIQTARVTRDAAGDSVSIQIQLQPSSRSMPDSVPASTPSAADL